MIRRFALSVMAGIFLVGPAEADRPKLEKILEDYRQGPHRQPYLDKILQDAARVELSDSVDEKEARALADAYFLMCFGACGGVHEIEDRGELWEAAIRVGYFGNPGPPIIVDKKTGETSAEGKESVPGPQFYSKFAEGK